MNKKQMIDNVVMVTDPYSKEEGINQPDFKSIDIVQHLQLSTKCSSSTCTCPTKSSLYCVPCKINLCLKCNFNVHEKHFLLNKTDYDLSETVIINLFKSLEDDLNNSKFFLSFESLREDLISEVNNLANELYLEINKLRDGKLKEINQMFENMNKIVTNTKERVSTARNHLISYLEKNKSFFKPIKEEESENIKNESHLSNIIFFMNYDLLSLTSTKCKDIISIENDLINDYKTFKEKEQENNNKIMKELKSCLSKFEYNKEKLINKTQRDPKAIDGKSNENRKKFTREQIHRILNPNSPRKKDGEDFENQNLEMLDMSKPNFHFMKMCQKLNFDHFKPIIDRCSKFNSEIEKFKREVMSSLHKTGNFKDIEHNINYYENSKEKGIDSLFSKRNFDGKGKVSLRHAKSQESYTALDEVSLENPVLEKYFSYLMTDLYGKYFKMERKELQSSHADLFIKVNEDEEEDFGKVIEGTNEIMFYEKILKKIVKKKVKLTKNPYGYIHFPIGCRSLLIGDKLYITGGKSEIQEYPNVIIYNRKHDSLKRIMDMKEARSYHTMIYNEVFETIMVFGGENKSSVEFFDPLSNRWQMLPSMVHPRANNVFYFNKPSGIFYVMFGVDGNITNNSYNDTIEYLDLADINKGWTKMNYHNKTGLNLKNYLNVLPLNNELMLIFGGITARNNTRTVCVLNIPKAEIRKVDKKLLETIRNESKKNSKLSAIVSTINLNN